jgi:hypothetical protein
LAQVGVVELQVPQAVMVIIQFLALLPQSVAEEVELQEDHRLWVPDKQAAQVAADAEVAVVNLEDLAPLDKEMQEDLGPALVTKHPVVVEPEVLADQTHLLLVEQAGPDLYLQSVAHRLFMGAAEAVAVPIPPENTQLAVAAMVETILPAEWENPV